MRQTTAGNNRPSVLHGTPDMPGSRHKPPLAIPEIPVAPARSRPEASAQVSDCRIVWKAPPNLPACPGSSRREARRWEALAGRVVGSPPMTWLGGRARWHLMHAGGRRARQARACPRQYSLTLAPQRSKPPPPPRPRQWRCLQTATPATRPAPQAGETSPPCRAVIARQPAAKHKGSARDHLATGSISFCQWSIRIAGTVSAMRYFTALGNGRRFGASTKRLSSGMYFAVI